MVTEACTVLTSQPGLCRPTEAVNVFVWDCCRFISILQSLFLYSFAQLSCALLQEVCKMCVSSSLPPKTEHSDCTFTAVQIGRAGRAPFPSPPGSTRAGARPATADQLQTRASVLHWGWGQEPMFKAASPCTEKSIFSHKTRRGMFGNHSLNERVPVLS